MRCNRTFYVLISSKVKEDIYVYIDFKINKNSFTNNIAKRRLRYTFIIEARLRKKREERNQYFSTKLCLLNFEIFLQDRIGRGSMKQ